MSEAPRLRRRRLAPAPREAYGDATEAEIDWRPSEPLHLVSLDIEDAAFVIYEEDEQRTTRWTKEAGVTYKVGSAG